MRIENGIFSIAIVVLIFLIVLLFWKRISICSKYLYIIWGVVSGCIILITILLLFYLLMGRVEFAYVYEYTNHSLPIVYKIVALLSGSPGTLLLWLNILACFGFLMVRYGEKSDRGVLGIYASIMLCITMFTVVSNPFALSEGVEKERGFASSLQNPWMLLHPPMMILGYTCMAVLFSMLIIVKKQQTWIKQWIQSSTLCLGIGILTGGIGAYQGFDWGVFWSWDAHCNIAFVPWLFLCASLHGIRYYTKAVCIVPFTLVAFGTLLASCGILGNSSFQSVILCGSNSAKIILIFILLVIVISTPILVKLKIFRLPKMILVDLPFLYRMLTYIYAALLLVATVIPALNNRSTPMFFYNTISIIYILGVIYLIIWYTRRASLGRIKKEFYIGHGSAILMYLGGIASTYNSANPFEHFFWIGAIVLILVTVVSYIRKRNSKYIVIHYSDLNRSNLKEKN